MLEASKKAGTLTWMPLGSGLTLKLTGAGEHIVHRIAAAGGQAAENECRVEGGRHIQPPPLLSLAGAGTERPVGGRPLRVPVPLGNHIHAAARRGGTIVRIRPVRGGRGPCAPRVVVMMPMVCLLGSLHVLLELGKRRLGRRVVARLQRLPQGVEVLGEGARRGAVARLGRAGLGLQELKGLLGCAQVPRLQGVAEGLEITPPLGHGLLPLAVPTHSTRHASEQGGVVDLHPGDGPALKSLEV